MARPLRGHAWPGVRGSTSKFIITAIQNCLIGSSSLETCHCCVSTISYLPLPQSHGHRLLLCAEDLSHGQMLCAELTSHGQMLSPQGRALWSELEAPPLSPGLLLLFPGTSTHLILRLCVLATPVHGSDCVYLPLRCLVKELFPRVC